MKRETANSSMKRMRECLREIGKSRLRIEERERSRMEEVEKLDVQAVSRPFWKSSIRASHSCGDGGFNGGLSVDMDIRVRVLENMRWKELGIRKLN